MVTTAGAARPSRVRTEGRLLRPDERAVVERMCEVLPGGRSLVADLHLARVREAVSWVGECSARSVVLIEHWGRRGGAVELPVRGVLLDHRGLAEGDVTVLAHGGALVGLVVRGRPARIVPAVLDPARVTVVPGGRCPAGPGPTSSSRAGLVHRPVVPSPRRSGSAASPYPADPEGS